MVFFFYRAAITENSKNGVNIATVVADDADKNRTMTYFIEGMWHGIMIIIIQKIHHLNNFF